MTKKSLLIDAPRGITPLIMQAAEQRQLKIEKIVITHSHWDHIADAAALKKTLKVPLYVHRLDQDNLRNPGADGLPLFFPLEGVEADGFLQEGDRWEIGQLEMQVIETPGHTPGGICLWFPKEKALFSGDTLFQGSIGKLNFPTSNASAMWKSLKKLAKLPPDTKVYPGHGEPTTLAAESWIVNAQSIYGGEDGE